MCLRHQLHLNINVYMAHYKYLIIILIIKLLFKLINLVRSGISFSSEMWLKCSTFRTCSDKMHSNKALNASQRKKSKSRVGVDYLREDSKAKYKNMIILNDHGRDKKSQYLEVKGEDQQKHLIYLSVCCRIKHKNIVSLEDIFESQTHLYLVMQL